MQKYVLFYDADEVLNYFAKYVIARYNKDFDENFQYADKKLFEFQDDMIKGDKEYFNKVLSEKGLWANVEPVEGGIETLRKLHNEGYEIVVVTAPMWNDHCPIEKMEWFKKNFSFLNPYKSLVYAGSKFYLAGPNRVLLDDKLDNLEKWDKAGGIAVAFDRPWNQDWKGPRVFNHDEFYNLIKGEKL